MGSGQSSIEYIIIMGFAFTAIAILFVVYYEHDSSTKAEIVFSQVDRIGRKIIDTAETNYFLGEPTRSTLKVYMPTNVETINISVNELNFRIRTKNGLSDLEFSTDINLTGHINSSQGIKYISVIAQSGHVCIVQKGDSCP